MGYAVAAGSVIAISAEGTLHGQQVMTTFHYKENSLIEIPDGRLAAIEMLTKIHLAGGLAELYLACMSQAVNNVEWYAQWITPTRFAYIAWSGLPAQGTILEESMPPNVAQVATRRGDRANRHNISNLHLPGVPVPSVVDGRLNAIQADRLQQLATESCDPITLVTGNEMVPVAFWRGNPFSSAQVVEGYPQDTTRVMRRRTVGLGS